jgi:hypothetical protein
MSLHSETVRRDMIYTVGHSTRSAGELLALLSEADVKLVADVRRFPNSRRHPQFNSAEMSRWLADAGLGYVHLPGLGGRREPVSNSVNGGWHERAFQGYADHLASAEFKSALSELEAAARETPTSIMCAEAVWWRCHRRLVADALVVHGWRVEHLGVPSASRVHRLPEFAVGHHDGTITYPPMQMTMNTGGPEDGCGSCHAGSGTRHERMIDGWRAAANPGGVRPPYAMVRWEDGGRHGGSARNWAWDS